MSTNEQKNILRCETLTKTYGNGENIIYAVRECNLSVEQGAFTAITGESGSGKSTLLNMLATFEKPTSGHIYLNNIDYSMFSRRELNGIRNRTFGFVFQNYQLLPILTAKENILMPRLIGGGETGRDLYFRDLVEMLEISDRLDHLPGELSGGQQQRVAVARALINNPQIVFADEPTGNLDSANSKKLIGMLLDVKERFHQTLVMVTHDMETARKADVIYHIQDGVVKKA